ncbi:MAG: L-aspartate oxidase [Candidatus Bipolaricaulaceae bacterium]
MRAVEADVLILGAGIAGLATALRLVRDRTRQIVILTREDDPKESNTYYAQGGIAALGVEDSPELFALDILRAGAGLSDPQAVRILVEEGPALVQKLLVEEAGVAFDRTADGAFHLVREGGHSRARVLHVGDRTGAAIVQALHDLLRSFPNVQVVPAATAVELITSPGPPLLCHGAYVLEQRTGEVRPYLAGVTVLATGGLGRLFRHTTNPPGARGDGLALAHRAGARVIHCEYVQFHPTTLALPQGENFLISEAVRGEGGRLLTPDGRFFMEAYAPGWGDLAPRDVVCRAIFQEMRTHGYPYVLLDVSKVPHFAARFPTIFRRLRELGLSVPEEPIPVVPAAHYFCGGVWTDEWGRTSLERLFAVGEVACTGVHGANRLASTALLEGLVFGDRAGRKIAELRAAPLPPRAVPPWDAPSGPDPDPARIQRLGQTLQTTMWEEVGIVRDAQGLARALRILRELEAEVEELCRRTRLTDALAGLRAGVRAARLVAEAAWRNPESRGVHFRRDGGPGPRPA